MKLRNKKTGEITDLSKNGFLKSDNDDHIIVYQEGTLKYYAYNSIAELNEEWEVYAPQEPLIKDEKIRKAVRAWADVLEIDEVEFYGSETWIGFRAKNTGTGWSSKFELDYFGSENTLVPFRTYTIDELCGEEEE